MSPDDLCLSPPRQLQLVVDLPPARRELGKQDKLILRNTFVVNFDCLHQAHVFFDDELWAGVGVMHFFRYAEADVGDFAGIEKMNISEDNLLDEVQRLS